ncbi:LysM peptidoglycan-binding domain-containing protein [Gorillibacterium sp. CAU 1737]|uniref:muramidase family protein n=1 Tax=Gorillibacterium sp. CAU 1737 TaxID=3140362 RepID=UPI00326108BA
MATQHDSPVAIYLSYNNQKEGFILPVLPESIEISNSGNDATYSTAAGEIQVIKSPKLREYKFNSMFPYNPYPFIMAYDYNAKDLIAMMERWMKTKAPIRFIYKGTGYSINEAVSIASFTWKEVAGTPGDIEYDLTLKRYVFYGARLVKNEKEAAKSGKTEKRPEQTTPATYKLKAGDSLWKVSQKFKVSVAALQKLNKISDAEVRRLAIGRELKLR